MDLLRDVKRKQLKIKIAIILVVVVLLIVAILVFIHIKRNRDNDVINKYIINSKKNAVITIANDMSKIKLYPKTLEDIKSNNKTIQVSNNEAMFLLNSNYLQETNKVNPKVTTTNKYAQLNNVVCVEIDMSPVKEKQLIDKITINTKKLNLDTEYVDLYSINENEELSALKLKEPIINNTIQTTYDVNIEKYIVAYVPVVNLAFNYNEINLKKGEEVVLTCDVNENATNSQLHAQVTDPDIIEVSANGTIKAINPGKTQLIIQSYKNTVLKTIDVIVKEIPSEIKVEDEKITIYVGETSQIEATVIPETVENKNVKYSSSNNNIATVNSKGKITGVKKGTTKITITTEETPEVSKEIEVTVKEKASEIKTEQDEVEINMDDSYELNVTVLPDSLDNKKVKYKSSNENIATVSNNGRIKGISEGTAEITITTEVEPQISKVIIVHVKKKQIINSAEDNNINNNIIINSNIIT